METTTIPENESSFFRFEDLRIYDKSQEYCSWIMKQFPEPRTECQKVLVGSFCHSAYDMALNIAEGSSRNRAQMEHYLKIAKTAIRECVVYSAVAHNDGMLTDEQYDRSRELLMELTRMVGACIISLQRGTSRRSNDSAESEGGEESAWDKE